MTDLGHQVAMRSVASDNGYLVDFPPWKEDYRHLPVHKTWHRVRAGDTIVLISTAGYELCDVSGIGEKTCFFWITSYLTHLIYQRDQFVQL